MRLPLAGDKPTYRWLKSCRKKLHFSQSEMAELLGVRVSTYRMMELGYRTLHTANIKEVAQFMDQLQRAQASAGHASVAQQHQEACQQAMQACRADLAYRLQRAQRELRKLQDRYATHLKKAESIHALHQSEQLGRKLQTFLQLLQHDCELHLKRCTPLHQAKLQLRICSLKAQIELIDGMVGEDAKDN